MADKQNVRWVDDEWIRAVHDSPLKLVLVTTGGGSGAISRLLETSGASRTVLEASVPYAAPALAAWLGGKPERYCATATARAMAMVGWQRARQWTENDNETTTDNDHVLAGVASTASLASDRPKRGPHRMHMALQTAELTMTQSVEFVKGRRNRREEEAITTTLLLNLIAAAAGVAPLETGLADDEPIQTHRRAAPDQWRELLTGKVDHVDWPLARRAKQQADTRVVFPGAFNPLHDGHRRMAEIASRRLGAAVTFELSIENVDKPPLDYIEIERRCGQFTGLGDVCLTRAPTFAAKAELFPGATFIVGADTAQRIAEPRYYDDNPAACQAAIERIATLGCRLLVFGRTAVGGFKTLDDLSLPANLRMICDQVDEKDFRCDVSSTKLRREADATG